MSRPEYSVLLVEDDAMVRNWLRLALNGSEFRVAGEASNAAEARELVKRRKPDVPTNREIAAALRVGEQTVKTHLARGSAKLGVRRRAEAASAAHTLGLL